MKFKVASTLFLQQLSAVNKIINGKNALSILDNFLLTLSENRLTITGSDQENTMKAVVETLEAEGEGSVAVNAKRLLEMLKEVSGQPLTFAVDDASFKIDIDFLNGHFAFMGTDGKEYPSLDVFNEEPQRFVLPASIIQSGIENTLYAAGTEIIRPVMTGVYWDVCRINPEGDTIPGITFVATDTHKLVRYINTEVNPGITTSFIMPAKPAGILRSLIGKEDGDATVELYEKNATIHFGDYTLSCRFINGRFPDYNRVIPQENPFEMIVDRTSLLNAVRRMALFASQASSLVKLKLGQNELELTSRDTDYGTAAEEKVTCSYNGNEMTMGFNADYLIEVLSNLPGDTIKMRLCDPARPGIFTPEEKTEGVDLLILLMPMQVNDLA